jgi:hypothetical protein
MLEDAFDHLLIFNGIVASEKGSLMSKKPVPI